MVDRLDKSMNYAMEAHVAYPHHKDALVVLNRQLSKCRKRETEDPFLESFVSRAEWKAVPCTVEPQPLQAPVTHVRYWKFSNTDACRSKMQCIYVVQDLQQRHIEVGFGDIRYNFLVGGDGHIFEGRGWDQRAPEDPLYEHDKENHLQIGFIGDIRIRSKIYDQFRLQLQLEAARHLIEYGKRNKLIDEKCINTWKDKN